jgi:hypothetical protein
MPDVFIAMPAHSGQVMVPTACAIAGAYTEAHQLGWQMPELHILAGYADLIHARNKLIYLFLKSECTHLLMVDADLSWMPGAFERIVSHPVDFVGGIYRRKTDEVEQYPVLFTSPRQMHSSVPLLEVQAIPIGFARLTRSCVEQLVETVGDKKLHDDDAQELPWLIDFEYRDGLRLEEGFSLCRRWREMGGQVWLDPMIKLGHTGLKTFPGDLMARIQADYEGSGSLDFIQRAI